MATTTDTHVVGSHDHDAAAAADAQPILRIGAAAASLHATATASLHAPAAAPVPAAVPTNDDDGWAVCSSSSILQPVRRFVHAGSQQWNWDDVEMLV